MATAVTSAVVVSELVPAVLAEAGFDEAEVRAGLALFTSVFAILGLRAVVKSRATGGVKAAKPKASENARPAKNLDSPGPKKPPQKKQKPEDKKPPKEKQSRTKRNWRRKVSPRQARMDRGIAFNLSRRGDFPYNEVRVYQPDGKGHFVLDSYDPDKGEIVFRRETQLSEIATKTAIGYFREFLRKYPPGRVIADTPANPPEIRGTKLSGVMILEVPVQWKAIPKKVLAEAARRNIRVRDASGKVH